MILFKPAHVAPILSGRKTQTRRTWDRCRVKVGSIHQARTNMPWQDEAGHFANLRITATRQELLAEISDDDVYAEGYDSFTEYCEALVAINGGMSTTAVLWVVSFEVAP